MDLKTKSLIADFIIGFCLIHRNQNYTTINSQGIASLRDKRPTFFQSIDTYLGIQFTVGKIPQLLLKVFRDCEPSSYGIPALNIVDDIIQNNQLPITNNELTDFCTNYQASKTTNNPNSQPSVQLIQTESNTSEFTPKDISKETFANIVKSIASELRKEFSNNHNHPMEETMKNLYQSMLTNDVKDSHYLELEHLIEKKHRFTKNQTVLKSYLQNKIYPSALDQSKFPSPMFKHDSSYRERFNSLITSFQERIMNFNLEYIEDKVQEIETQILEKSKLIETYDREAKTKAETYEKEITKKFKPALNSAMEKVNRIVSKTTNSNTIQNRSSTNQTPRTSHNKTSFNQTTRPTTFDKSRLNFNKTNTQNNYQNNYRTNFQNNQYHQQSTKTNYNRFNNNNTNSTRKVYFQNQASFSNHQPKPSNNRTTQPKN